LKNNKNQKVTAKIFDELHPERSTPNNSVILVSNLHINKYLLPIYTTKNTNVFLLLDRLIERFQIIGNVDKIKKLDRSKNTSI